MSSEAVPVIAVIVASTRSTRFADYPLAWITDRLTGRADLAIEVIDLREHPLPFYDLPTSPTMAGRNYTTDAQRTLGEAIDRADGFLVIANEYNHGYSAALKNTLDHFFPEFNRKPVAFAGYGSAGGSRAIEQLRQVVAELAMVSIRYSVHIMGHQMALIRQDAGARASVFESLDARLDLLIGELVWWARVLHDARAQDASSS